MRVTPPTADDRFRLTTPDGTTRDDLGRNGIARALRAIGEGFTATGLDHGWSIASMRTPDTTLMTAQVAANTLPPGNRQHPRLLHLRNRHGQHFDTIGAGESGRERLNRLVHGFIWCAFDHDE